MTGRCCKWVYLPLTNQRRLTHYYMPPRPTCLFRVLNPDLPPHFAQQRVAPLLYLHLALHLASVNLKKSCSIVVRPTPEAAPQVIVWSAQKAEAALRSVVWTAEHHDLQSDLFLALSQVSTTIVLYCEWITLMSVPTNLKVMYPWL